MTRPQPGPQIDTDLFAALTGREAPAGEGRIAAALRTAYGERGDGRPDTTVAARRLGVSTRTVRRWLQQEREGLTPASTNVTRLEVAARRARTTRRGRAAALRARRAADAPAPTAAPRSRGRGAPTPALPKVKAVSVTGSQGPVGAGNNSYKRYRTIRLSLSDSDNQAMLDAYERGGDAGFAQWLTDRSQGYVSGWQFDDVSDLTLG